MGIILSIWTFLNVGVIVCLTYCKLLQYPIQFIPIFFACWFWISGKAGQRWTRQGSIWAYRGIYVLMGLLNEVYRLPFISCKVMMTIYCAIGFTLCLIHGFAPLSAMISLLATLMLISCNLILSRAKSIYEESRKFIQKTRRGNSCGNRLALDKTAASLRECRIYSGSTYFIDRGVQMKANDTILNCIIDNVIMFNSFG